jgi:glycosyltransferase involved in cell wall biosynthesis
VDRILIIDDGSADSSVSVLEGVRAQDHRVTLVAKANGGQLSAFNVIAELVDSEDLVFLLDADDLYNKHHIDVVVSCLEPHVDFYMIAPARFHAASELADNRRVALRPVSAPYAETIERSVYLSSIGRSWVCVPTSGIAVRGRLLKQALPYNDLESWVACADDVLATATSILAARKKLIYGYHFNYRIHGNNNYARRKSTRSEQRRKYLAQNNSINHYRRAANVPKGFGFWALRNELKALPPQAKTAFFHEPFSRFVVRALLHPGIVWLYGLLEAVNGRRRR